MCICPPQVRVFVIVRSSNKDVVQLAAKEAMLFTVRRCTPLVALLFGSNSSMAAFIPPDSARAATISMFNPLRS